jgi:hypothetical protein
MKSTIISSVIILRIIRNKAECHYVKCRHAVCHGAVQVCYIVPQLNIRSIRNNAECPYVKCRYAECHGAVQVCYIVPQLNKRSIRNNAECHSVKCRHAECHGAVQVCYVVPQLNLIVITSTKRVFFQFLNRLRPMPLFSSKILINLIRINAGNVNGTPSIK